MKIVAPSLLALMLVSAPAIAADAPSGPCSRSGAQMQIGGVDLDVVRCQNALDAQRMGEMQSQLNAAAAALTLARQDAAAAQAERAKLAKELADAEAQKATLIEWLTQAQGEARVPATAGAQK